MSWYRQGLQVAIELVSDRFCNQAYLTAFDIGLNISLKARPIVFPANKVFSFIDAKMSYQRIIVLLTDNFCSNYFKYKQ